jgi:spore coat polysaccharide biosynthesis protein SpsF
VTTGGVAVVIQARTGSTRLRGKVLAELAGRPMLRFQLDRLRGLRSDHLVVATSDLPADDAVASVAEEAGAMVIRGSELDVLERFGLVIDTLRPAVVVRLTADCPLSDPELVAEVMALHRTSAADYTSNVHPRSYPIGLDVEVATASALRAAVEEATDPFDREHVTPFLYRHPARFSIANLSSGQDLAALRWTVDTPDDLDHVRRILDLLDDPESASWRDILAATQQAGLS